MKHIRQFFSRGIFSLVLLHSAAAIAEDIDIFSANPLASTDLPNVLFVWDNTANWSTPANTPACKYYAVDAVGNALYTEDAYGTKTYTLSALGPVETGTKLSIEQCALHNTLAALPTKSDGSALFRIGFLMFSEQTSIKGAYPRIAFTELTSANKNGILAKIKALEKNADKGANALYSAAMHEAWLYFSGGLPYTGNQPTLHDTSAFSGGRYRSYSTAGCNRNHVIFISNGSPDSNENNSCPSLLASAGGSMSPPTGTTGTDAANCIEEYARFMYGADVSSKDDRQNIISHAIAVVDPTKINTNPEQGYQLLMQATARFGGGSYYLATNADQIVRGLLDTFNSMLAVESVFAAASLPVSVTGQSQGYYLNQIYMGQFRPDPEAKPRWPGNLKMYQFKLDLNPSTGALDLFLTDATGNSAAIDTDGFIKPSAVSFWTQNSTFWANKPLGSPPSVSDSPDGDVVEKGGVAQRLRTQFATSQDSRKIYTATSSNARVEFKCDESAIASADLGVDDTGCAANSQRKLLIDWIRGADNKAADNESGPGGTTTVRSSIHGDVLHSRPAVVSYGNDSNLLVLYGANDGMLHAIDGAKTGATAGQELWAFIPRESYGKLKRLRDNFPEIRLPNSASATAQPRDYFMDGDIATYKHGDNLYAYIGARRGGRFMYALDITNKTSPSVLWKIDNTTISSLGQTWSAAHVGKVKGITNPVLFMGAGYDPAEDSDPPGTATMGKAVLAIDAITGTLLKAWTTDFPVAADVRLVADNAGYIERVYAADVGGNVYRLAFATAGGLPDPISKVASIDPGRSQQRKFFYAPGVLKDTDSTGQWFYAVMIGTGDREKPLKNANNDFFYVFKDYGGAALAHDDLITLAPCTAGTGECLTPTTDDPFAPEYKGCKVDLPFTGEKVVNAALASYTNSYYGTSVPSVPTANSCSNALGKAYGYGMGYLCQRPFSQEFSSGGFPPSPVGGVVMVSTSFGGREMDLAVPFVIGGVSTTGQKSDAIGGKLSGKSFVGASSLKDMGGGKKSYWYLDRRQ